MKELNKNIKYFVKNTLFMSVLIIVTLLGYGFAITHMSIGIDDLALDKYVDGTYILSQNRWATWLTYNLLGINEYSPFFSELITTLIYFCTAILVSSIIKTITRDKISNISYIIFSCMYISFPILVYPYTYQSTNITVALSNFVLILLVYLIYKNYFVENKKEMYIAYGLISSCAIAMYESCIQTYMGFAIMIILLHLKYVDNKFSFKKIIKLGLIYVVELLIGILGYLLIGFIIKTYLRYTGKITESFAYSKSIFEAEDCLLIIWGKLVWLTKFARAEVFLVVLKYLNIIFIILGIFEGIKNKAVKYFLLNLGIVAVNFIFCFAFEAIVYRMFFSWAVLVGFESLYIYEILTNIKIKNKNIKYMDKILIIIFAFVIFIQLREMYGKFYKDYTIAEKSKNTAITIGNTIVTECTNYNTKPLVYTNVSLRPGLDYETDVLYWAETAFKEDCIELTKYINYFGFNFIMVSQEEYDKDEEGEKDYEKRIKHNNYVSEGEKYIYVTIDYN